MLRSMTFAREPATKPEYPPHSHRAPAEFARRSLCGPFDVIGDVHGCLEELLELMARLGYRVRRQAGDFAVTPPGERKLAFVGDLVDRGPATPGALRLAMKMVRAGQAYCVPGNRDAELVRALQGRSVQITHGLAMSLEQLASEPEEFRVEAMQFLDGLPGHCVFDEGRLVIAHAGLKETLHGSSSAEACNFALRGETAGQKDALPIRSNWAADYRGKALVVFGHTPVAEPLWMNNTVNIDTGCVYGGHLTALRYPERETVSVPARAIYSQARRPFRVNDSLGA